MQRFRNLRADFLTTGAAFVVAAALLAGPLTPVEAAPSPPTVAVHDVRLAATAVPPAGLITSFLHNQTVYCSIICPLLAQTAVTSATTALRAPATFLAALSAGDVLKAIGAAAASVTGPTEAAAQRAIDADAAIPAQRALNAFEVGVVGLLNVLPAVADGVPGIAAALHKARRDTYDALNLPFVPNPAPTVTPRGVFQVAVVAAINVVAAVIFPAFNTILAGVFEIPDAVAQELARTGNPARALVAGIKTTGDVVVTAGRIVAESVVTAVNDVREAAGGQSADANSRVPEADSSTAAQPDTLTTAAPRTAATNRDDNGSPSEVTANPVTTKRAQPNPLRAAASHLRHAVHNLVRKGTPRPAGNSPDTDTSQHETGSPSDNDATEYGTGAEAS